MIHAEGNEEEVKMDNIREEIKTKLLQSIKGANLAVDVLEAIRNFNQFNLALEAEEEMKMSREEKDEG